MTAPDAATCLCVSLMDTSKCPVHGGTSAAPDAPRPAANVTGADPRVGAVLAAHRLEFERRVYPSHACSCGGWDGAQADDGTALDGMNDTADGHDAHVAAALAEAGIGPVAEAERRGAEAVLAAVEKVHTSRDESIYSGECIEGDCEHYDADTYKGEYPTSECPVLADAACAHCSDQTAPEDGWEWFIRNDAFWPCATLRAARAAAEQGRR